VDVPLLTLEAVLWLGGPLVASAAVALAGVYLRSRRVGIALLSLGLLGALISVGWILLVLRVEAVVE
jgi:hypothetical protein